MSLDSLSRDEASTVEGSGIIASSTPALAKLNLTVYELVVGFGDEAISELTPPERLTRACERSGT